MQNGLLSCDAVGVPVLEDHKLIMYHLLAVLTFLVHPASDRPLPNNLQRRWYMPWS